MATYKTPGVYVEEISTLPASVAQVATAIPAFIGYTEKSSTNGTSLKNVPTRITSLLEYEKRFGGPQPEKGIKIKVNWDKEGNRNVKLDSDSIFSEFVMYYQMQMYFANGGGPCYIVSVGTYEDDGKLPSVDVYKALEAGLNALASEDEPTLIVFPDAKGMETEGDFYNLYEAALAQCHKLMDRFTIIDVYSNDTNLRNELSSDYLSYGAVYYPDLKTALSYTYNETDVEVESLFGKHIINNKISVRYNGPKSDSPVLTIVADKDVQANAPTFSYNDKERSLQIKISNDNETTIKDFLGAWKEHPEKGPFDIIAIGEKINLVSGDATTEAVDLNYDKINLKEAVVDSTQAYNQIKVEISKHNPILAPSAAIAGVYARTDRDRGVWKAPANTSLARVIAPTIRINDAMQENLNVDPNSGKSINAIRSFFGKGTLVWGARTLAGNDNEWRYVSTRRFYIMAEESIKKGTAWVVFEPNDAQTWVKVKAQIENFLTGLWRAGALAGASPNEAFFINVGLGITMDTQDILEGRMNIEIGMAVVRPAEFIILKFSHMLQKS